MMTKSKHLVFSLEPTIVDCRKNGFFDKCELEKFEDVDDLLYRLLENKEITTEEEVSNLMIEI